ncbi:MAG: TPM domain-containing protein [Lachnospiraceae bacterium]|nr:TPM domain-containing protein [Lachnospiraceae bacterium]
MKKRITAFMLVFVLCISFGMTVFADSDGMPRLVDMADLLSEKDEKELLSMLDEISQRQQVDIIVVTTNSLDGKTPMTYADDFYDDNGYGFGKEKDGVLFLISMKDRDWWISTTGYGITAFTDSGITYMSERFLPDLSDGDYMEAFTCFSTMCDQYITQARMGEPYDIDSLPKEPFNFGYNVGIAILIGFIFAIIVILIMMGSMKSVRFQSSASNYVKSGSMKITQSRDLFLYAHIDRRKRETETSSGGGSRTHTSSSGTSHGGKGGKF